MMGVLAFPMAPPMQAAGWYTYMTAEVCMQNAAQQPALLDQHVCIDTMTS
jgi:hypothetical protein